MQKLVIPVLFSLFLTTVSAQESNFSDIPKSLSIKDSLLSSLTVHDEIDVLDSLWRQELYNTDLFEEMYLSLTTLGDEEVEYEELSTELLKERLVWLNAKTPFNVEYNASLEAVIKSYLKNRRNALQRIMNLSEYYFPMFEQELDRHNLPLELKYLAIVESALNPRAKSRVGATGIWQFMFQTGKMFDLDVSSYVDERSDPLRATVAACQYLGRLYGVFNDWDLALAAYNSGPGNVSKAIRRSGGQTNYWDIRRNLPRETAGYVPAFLATMYIFEYAEEHGFKLPKKNRPFIATDTIHVKHTVRFDQIAKILNIQPEEIRFLNPSYKLDIIPYVKGKKYTLRLPVEDIGRFVSNEDIIYAYVQEEAKGKEEDRPKMIVQNDRVTYRVKSGDYLGRIAALHGVSVANIKDWNGLRSNTVRIGQRLTIYPSATTRTDAVAANSKKVMNEGSKAAEKVYTVRSGDSLWSIAQKFPGVSVDNIKKWNDISATKLKPGMKLKILRG